MEIIIEIPRNKINAKNREAQKYWHYRNVSLYGLRVGSRWAPKRAVLIISDNPDSPSPETALSVLNLKRPD